MFTRLQRITPWLLLTVAGCLHAESARQPAPGSNPLVHDKFTADPAPLAVDDTVYLYVGHDEAKEGEMFNMNEWLCYSSQDMKHWKAHGPIMQATDFAWAIRDAWAAQVVERDGRYYLYATVQHDKTHPGKAIGVAVSDQPTGPFEDARGSALITDDTTPSPYGWDDIDPTVLIDDDGTPWLAWGNPTCYLVKLKPNMIELDGPIQRLPLPNYTEGPWLSKRGDIYYLTYPAFAHQGFSERMCYATAPAVTGPWTYRGQLTGEAENSYTIHPGILNDFKGHSYLFYHNATLTLPDGQTGGLGRRAVRVEYLHYNPDGTMQPVEQTEAGVSVPPQPAKVQKAKDKPGKSERGLKVHDITRFFPESWSGQPALSTVANPFYDTPVAASFNRDNATSIGQSFVPAQDMTLGRIAFYAGDGLGTQPGHLLTLALYDLGPQEDTQAATASYTAAHNLLGREQAVDLAYAVQAPGLLEIDLSRSLQVELQAGHRYVLELQGERGNASLFWRRSRADAYPEGAAYVDRSLAQEKDGQSVDFALALYPVD
ncbi:MAG: glycoside hydrolase family protein [Puniceicoccaceae bacterium 5H]|nr:MAG: glycoside hydrolase family protein [Puniceicoccaceae bacterium 5H]